MALSRTDVGIWVAANTIGTAAFTTGSFTPPDNSLLVIACSTMRDAATNTTLGRPTITDSLGSPLTYIEVDFANLTAFFATQLTVWYAEVGTGTSMTITFDDPNNFDMFGYQVCIFAFTGYDRVIPITGKADTGTTNIGDGGHAVQLTATPNFGDYSLIFLYVDSDSTASAPVLDADWVTAFDSGTSGGGGTLTGIYRTGSTNQQAGIVDVYTGAGSFFKGSMLALNVMEHQDRATAGGSPKLGLASVA